MQCMLDEIEPLIKQIASQPSIPPCQRREKEFFMNCNILNFISSSTLKKHLLQNEISLSPMQQATIIMEYASDEDKITALRTLAKETTNEAEKLLFETAVQEIKEQGFDGIKTEAVYTQYFSHIENPKYPFIEVCNLPILFKKGDVIKEGEQFFLVAGTPEKQKLYDFTDECYLCYLLTDEIKTYDDLVYFHDHIHVCDAESCEVLSEEQKSIAENIMRLLL